MKNFGRGDRWNRRVCLFTLVISLTLPTVICRASGLIDQSSFRDLFFGALPDSVSRQDLDQLLYLPTASLNQAPRATTAEAFLAQVDGAYRAILPSDLFREGEQAPATRLPTHRRIEALRKHPLTVVLLPGVFSEFVDSLVFGEVFSNASRDAQAWRRVLLTNADSIDATDQYRSLSSTEPSPVSLGDLVRVASLDDADGRPLVHLVLLSAPRMSLESVGDFREGAQIALRRLGKYFRLMGNPANVVLLGYSRGTMVGLEMLARAKEAGLDWLPQVRALVALGGVTFGSDLADETLIPGSSNFHLLQLFRELRQRLQPLAPGMNWRARAKQIYDNSVAIKDFGKGALQVGLDQSMLTLMLSLLRPDEQVDVPSSLTLIHNFADTFGLTDSRLLTQYSDNIRRAQTFIDQLDLGIQQLTTPARLQWWRENTIPAKGIRYYAIAGTMADPREEPDLGKSSPAHDNRLLDYQLLLRFYRHFRLSSGFALNDSQVAAQKVRFWPELISLLNSRQEPIDATFLGVVATDHWGLALPYVIPMKSHETDPYPRRALLEAIGGAVAIDLEDR